MVARSDWWRVRRSPRSPEWPLSRRNFPWKTFRTPGDCPAKLQRRERAGGLGIDHGFHGWARMRPGAERETAERRSIRELREFARNGGKTWNRAGGAAAANDFIFAAKFQVSGTRLRNTRTTRTLYLSFLRLRLYHKIWPVNGLADAVGLKCELWRNTVNGIAKGQP
jgi:hypothetical protein